ncbi:MAG: hypothetical protein AB7O88_01300 [Reyranellaceae bacterium]
MSRHWFIRLLIAAWLICVAGGALAVPQVCRLNQLGGFEDAWKRAKSVLPTDITDDPRRATVYIEKSEAGYYYHSNFKTPGHDYPTKVGTPDLSDAKVAFVNIVFDKRPSTSEWRQTERIFEENVQVIIDVSALGSDGRPLVDIGKARNVRIVDARGGRSLDSEALTTQRPPPSFISRIVGCCLFGRPPHKAKDIGTALAKETVSIRDIRVLNVARDSATESAISQSSLQRALPGKTAADVTTDAVIVDALRASRGKTMIFVGHVEDGHYVIRDAKQVEVYKIRIERLREIALKERVRLIDIGCKTAEQISADNLGVAVITEFNTVDAINAINAAAGRSKNMSDLLSGLASENIKLVIEESFLEGSGRTLLGGFWSRTQQNWFARVADFRVWLSSN